MKHIWLFGENTGNTANNNSFYFWEYVVEHHDDVDAYYIANRTPQVMRVYKALSPRHQAMFVWRNSFRHLLLYHRADMLFVTLSYRDVQPDRLLIKSYQPMPRQQLVYLQHGTIAIKQLGYKQNYANNCLFRWVCYNPHIAPMLQKVNGFKPYQILDGEYPPRYGELLRRAAQRASGDRLRILWFMTWREYFGENAQTSRFLEDIRAAVTDARLTAYLREKQAVLTICLHQHFTDEQIAGIRACAQASECLRLVSPKDIDVMDELAGSDVLVTDYSSVGFDFTFLNKPVILYQPDREAYLQERALYCTLEELCQASISSREELISCLVGEQYGINDFFAQRMHRLKDPQYVLKGLHIERMYQYFWEKQRENIAFLGYDFSGIGGTVFATRALAEGLMEQGYMVSLYTLKQVKNWEFPSGVPLRPMYNRYRPKLMDKLKVALVRGRWHYRHLNCDPARQALQPAAGFGMTYWMKHIHAKTVVSTRESLHLFLQEAQSEFICNRIYFFHTNADLVDQLFPGCLQKLQGMNLEKAVFVTEKNRAALKAQCGFDNYQAYTVLGNALDSSRSIERSMIEAPGIRQTYQCVYLLRISSERAADIAYMIDFARMLKARGEERIVLDIYGQGDYVDAMTALIREAGLEKIVRYCGATDKVAQVYREHDAVIDFSQKQSFGMTYIEAVLNGKMVFCRHNEGSDEVLAGMPECFYDTYEELYGKLMALDRVDLKMLSDHYEMIAAKYARETVAKRFIGFLGVKDAETANGRKGRMETI